ncbi:DUF7793 family protein [Flavihumibacter petaseus]|uniref:DUF7793 domain-containing protein n=1 Tax=Flavihumibacter petaseus NBRC 106054 TaxID=1220578 RepID=A0A0E9N5K3_9BACT|nr:hypothetical protein [Flavihumibacter petaseus]GAO45247.1 hypothetical protein FPE01S_04_04910 [Flavihumibacter petaseus NBRC 106054]
MQFHGDDIDLFLQQQILHVRYRKGLKIDLPTAQKMVAARLSFTGSRCYPVCLHAQGVRAINREARQYLSSPDGIRGLTAVAIVTSSPFQAMMGNILRRVHRVHIPVRLFSQPKSAEKWLLSLSSNNTAYAFPH